MQRSEMTAANSRQHWEHHAFLFFGGLPVDQVGREDILRSVAHLRAQAARAHPRGAGVGAGAGPRRCQGGVRSHRRRAAHDADHRGTTRRSRIGRWQRPRNLGDVAWG